jgi:folate-binding protein YgfZ
LTSIALPHLAAARARGTDAAAFLHAQLSADIISLDDGAATFACYCSPRGQVYGLLLIGRDGDEYVLLADAELLPDMLRRLGMFVLRARVELGIAEELAASGRPATEAAASKGLEFEPPGTGLCYRLDEASPQSSALSAQWKERELRGNIVWLNRQTTERFIPQMLGFDRIGAVNFNKGCYPGQEIIARARYLGQVKRKPLLLQVSSAPEWCPGKPLQLQDGSARLQATVVDSVVLAGAGAASESLLFVVAPVPEQPVETLEYEGKIYRCATI